VPHSSLDEETKELFRRKLRSKLSYEGSLRIVSQESRSQWKNKQTAIEKFVLLLKHALRPEKPRRPTGATRSSIEVRLGRKKGRGRVKKMRRIDLRSEL
jgi:ribosome-associated protein